MYKAIKLDENGYFNGTYIEGTDKKMLEMNGILVDEVPSDDDQELWKAYKFKDNKWEKDEDKYKKIKDKKEKERENDLIQEELEQIKQELNSLDYHTMKYIEGEYTEQEWKVYKDQKKELRKKYNDLEKGLR